MLMGQLSNNQPNAHRQMLMGTYQGKETVRRKADLLGNKQSESEKNYVDCEQMKMNTGNIVKSLFNKEKWLPIARDMPFLVSHYCCNVMKKSPLGIYGRQTKQKP